MKSWKELVERTYAARTNAAGTESRPIFYPPASALEIEEAEHRLEATLPETLKALLLECDGIRDQLSVDGGPSFDNLWVLWPVRLIIDENVAFRNRIAETSSNRAGPGFVFIASAGADGILFGLEATNKPRDDSPIVSRYPIGHRSCVLADTLAAFIDGWLTNRIAV